MYGAIIGDIVGSKYEFCNIKTKEFPLFSKDCDYTDDTIMTVAVARAIIKSREEQYKTNGKGKTLREFMIEEMQSLGRKYPYPKGAYGGNFSVWLRTDNPIPYNSCGNGSAMRVSPCGIAAVTLEEAEAAAYISAEVSHNHPEGIKGAKAVAGAVFLAKAGASKDEIREYITKNYYPLDFTIDEIRPTYDFDALCQGSVPQAIEAFLESTSFEDAIRNIISIGGDCDTTGAITGAVAWAYYTSRSLGVISEDMEIIRQQAIQFLPNEFVETADLLKQVSSHRAGTYDRTGFCTPLMTEKEWNRVRSC